MRSFSINEKSIASPLLSLIINKSTYVRDNKNSQLYINYLIDDIR